MRYEIRIVLLLAIFFGLIVWATPTKAAALVTATQGGITVTLTDEKCQLKAVSNMPNRATWREGNKVYEGCFMVRPDAGVVLAFFSDGAVALIPMAHFKPVEVM